MKITERIKKDRLFFDGGTGSVLQGKGLLPGEPTELMNTKDPEAVISLHLAYLLAGADVIKTNSFGINSLKCDEVEKELTLAVGLAKEAVRRSGKEAYVAFDVGPTGRMLKPFGDLDFEDAVSVFATNMRLAERLGADLILIETMSDLYETKAAVLAAKESSSLPVFVTCAFGSDGKLLTGATPEAMVAALEGLGADAIGMNCSVGPENMLKLLPGLLECSSVPIILNPNAGLPKVVDGETVYDLTPKAFASLMTEACRMGACLVGGCCGTTPEHIRALVDMARDIPVSIPEKKEITYVSSYTHAVRVGGVSKIVGERLNPTGKPRLKEALRSGDMSYLLSVALSEEAAGAHLLDLNTGLADIDEEAVMRRAVREIQAVTDLPLSIDTGKKEVMESALRIYNGKPLLNSVNGSRESMAAVFPLVKKYGAAVIALTMDESGIPETADGRVEIAEKIISEAKKYGIDPKELIFDPLTLTVASGKDNARITLETVRRLKALGYKCALGVSNVSFGLPEREVINSAFYTAALFRGLDLAIINPESESMMRAYHSYLALDGHDEGFSDYIAYVEGHVTRAESKDNGQKVDTPLGEAIEKGLKAEAVAVTGRLLETKGGLDIINEEIIPALDRVGKGFEEKRIYLPGLLMSAEAANAAFSLIRESVPASEKIGRSIVLATVKGDIHDIGKNIVKLIFESYGYRVVDLGRDVPETAVLDALRSSGADLLGLSALMTTTLPAMERTVALVKRELPHVRIIVGGAVLTGTYARKIGADFYAPDAISAVRYVEEINKE
ncbi:MAG: homocysteine S-methyltransferase family protein [Clostridia bacterium]|nr:homocysteine S-methyltransferase family protein [Clostridia bacterium]